MCCTMFPSRLEFMCMCCMLSRVGAGGQGCVLGAAAFDSGLLLGLLLPAVNMAPRAPCLTLGLGWDGRVHGGA